MAKCILCNAKATVNVQDNASRTIYNCQNCGVFVISDLVEKEVARNSNELAAYFTSRKLANHNDVVLVTFEKANKDRDYTQLTVDQILSHFPQSFSQLSDMVLMNLSRMSTFAGEEIKVEGLDMCPVFCVRKQNYDALSFVIKSMQKFELLEVNYYGSSFFPCGVILSPQGWDRVSQLEEGKEDRNTALVYLSDMEGEYSDIFRKVAKKAARECGFRVVEMGGSGINDKINYELITQIKYSKYVICDLTHATGGTYYTAAMASALDKVAILTCHQTMAPKLEMDTQQISVLTWKDEQGLYLQIFNAIRALI